MLKLRFIASKTGLQKKTHAAAGRSAHQMLLTLKDEVPSDETDRLNRRLFPFAAGLFKGSPLKSPFHICAANSDTGQKHLSMHCVIAR